MSGRFAVRDTSAARLAVPGWPPEAFALVADVRTALGRVGDRERQRIRAEMDSVAWRRYIALAESNAVLVLVHTVLEARESGFPRELLNEVRARVKRRVGLSYLFARKLLDLMDVLKEASVTAVPFKGPALAVALHGDLGLRSFTDLDLFVPSEQVPRAIGLLQAQGFVTVGTAESRRPVPAVASYHVNLVRSSDSLSVEIHWQLAPRYFAGTIDPARCLRRLTTVEVMGRSLPYFSDEDALLQLCVHGSKHLWGRLGWAVDTAMSVERRQPDWAVLLERARASGCERHLLLGLDLASRLFATELPKEVLRRIDSHKPVRRLTVAALNGLFAEQGADHLISVPRFYWLLQVRGQDRMLLLAYLLWEKALGRVRPSASDRSASANSDEVGQ